MGGVQIAIAFIGLLGQGDAALLQHDLVVHAGDLGRQVAGAALAGRHALARLQARLLQFRVIAVAPAFQ